MNRNRVLVALIGICLTAAVAEAQVAAAGRGGPPVPAQTAWWTDSMLMSRLGLTDLQKAKIEGAFQAHKQLLASAKETLEREEAQLSRLRDAESVDRSAVQLQVNKVIQARSEMERLNAAMTLEMREQLSRSQWAQLQQPLSGGRGGSGRGGGVPANPTADLFAARYD